MSDPSGSCHQPFDPSLLSGYLDHALTQAETQKVRVHLEDCASCRQLVDDMRQMREATMTTDFKLPPDEQWLESPRGSASQLAFGLGWILLLAWLVGVGGFALGHLWAGPQSLLEKVVVFGGISGIVLLFLSVLIDRLEAMKTDRYRRVKK